MSSPVIQCINKESIEDSFNEEKNDEQIIQINADPVQIFNPVPIIEYNGNNNTKDVDHIPEEDAVRNVAPIVHFEVDSPDAERINQASSSQIQPHQESKINSHLDQGEENVFMVPPLLRVRQFAVQERLPISIEEIRRRIGPPESLSQALILGLLRLNKERAKHLRRALGQFGITELPSRSAVVSSFSRLSEAESRGIAEDYYYLASKFMKVKEMNHALVAQNSGEDSFSNKARGTRLVLEQILAEIEKRDSDLNLLTHGFSPLILRAVFNTLIEVLSYQDTDNELVFDTPNQIAL